MFIAATVLSSLGALGMLALVASLALPLAWLWMLIDALLREEWEYPGSTGGNDKLLWVLLILFVHVSAVAYFFIVYRRGPVRGTVRRPEPSPAR